MKIDAQTIALALGFGLVSALVAPAFAETTVKDMAEQVVATTTSVAATGQPPAPAAALPVIQLKTLEEAQSEAMGVPGQVRAVLDKLEKGKIDLTLEDMNQARAALARLDLMLELEQKMFDLEKARAKRSGSDLTGEVSAMLPANVARTARGSRASLAVPPADFGAAAPVLSPSRRVAQPGEYDVQRITGLAGHYTATLESRDGQTHTVRVGDTLDDGAEVTAISATSVQIKAPQEKSSRNLRIANAAALSHGRHAP